MTEPGSRYIDFLVPGLLGLNLMSSGMWGIGYVIVEMRTRKLIKRLLATPMKKRDFLIAFGAMRGLFLLGELPLLIGFALARLPRRRARLARAPARRARRSARSPSPASAS